MERWRDRGMVAVVGAMLDFVGAVVAGCGTKCDV
jgi:hypothetical protein